MLILFFTIFSCFGQFPLGEGEECNLPKYEEKDVDWNMVDKHWYQTLNANNPINNFVKCFVVPHAMEIDNKVIMSVLDVRGNGGKPVLHGDIPMLLERQNNSLYRYDSNLEEVWIDDVKTPISGSPKREGKDVVKGVFKGTSAFYSDHEIYILNLECDATGKKLIFVLTPKPYPDVEVVLKVHNKLIEIGHGWQNIPLFLSGCTDLDFDSSKI